ncbi:UV radiation resistance associated protein [Microtus ochrogaster]|uniref:UV radiation resistance associated protein n=1 Tax=Microtus ochrogaster TaxID=79684 RepID=A0A8J6FX14_MICOH|nr:UV radiation resistance associated protein [Microtus ochrogaster]
MRMRICCPEMAGSAFADGFCQRRLRHLRNIAARNIVNRNGHQLLDTYFTLHLCNNEKICKEFYRSEVIKNSLNPTWRSLDFGIMPDHLDTSVCCFVVKIWGGKDDAYQLLIEWKVYLDGLKYLGQQIHARNQNEIIFGLNDGYYGAPFEHKGHSHVQKNILQVDQHCVRNSYDVFSLLRRDYGSCAGSCVDEMPAFHTAKLHTQGSEEAQGGLRNFLGTMQDCRLVTRVMPGRIRGYGIRVALEAIRAVASPESWLLVRCDNIHLCYHHSNYNADSFIIPLHRAQCAIKQTQVTVQRIGKEIEEKLRLTSTSNELKKESECLRLKILVLRNELERQKKALGREVAFLQKQQVALQDTGSAFSTEHGKLQHQKESLGELRKECTAKRELFLKTNAQLTIRCRQLLSELSYIYPIDLENIKTQRPASLPNWRSPGPIGRRPS